jgi:hypothetical protein
VAHCWRNISTAHINCQIRSYTSLGSDEPHAARVSIATRPTFGNDMPAVRRLHTHRNVCD